MLLQRRASPARRSLALSGEHFHGSAETLRFYPPGLSNRAFVSSGKDEFEIQVEALRGSAFSQARAVDSIWLLRSPSSPIVAAHCTAACGSEVEMRLVKALTAWSRDGPSDKFPSQLAAAVGSVFPQVTTRF